MISIKLSGVVNNGVIVLSFISSSFQSTMSLKACNIPNEIRKNISHQKCESVDTHGNRRPTKLLSDTLEKNGVLFTMGEENIKKRKGFSFLHARPSFVHLLPCKSFPRVSPSSRVPPSCTQPSRITPSRAPPKLVPHFLPTATKIAVCSQIKCMLMRVHTTALDLNIFS